MFDSIYETLLQIVDRHIPTRQPSKSEQKLYSKPWITPALKTSIRVKNASYRKYLKTKSVYVRCKFKYYRNRLSYLLRASERLYYNNYFLVNINNSKKVWNGIKGIVPFKSKTSQKIIKIVQNNVELIDPKIGCECI